MYYFYPHYYPLYSYPNCFSVRQFPPVDPDMFYESANEMKNLINDASEILDRLATSKDFAKQLMLAAQESDMEEVTRLIHTANIVSDLDVNYNPESLRLDFKKKTEENEIECCRLLVTLRWR
ncbi:hypothetical protein [Virgibacillus sp. YIM 98842]|jgi:hypothetical protein|uniref:hypothetical protein n=1 Tax=Virgibacillus sp. YIM 98842 TaxID=2663533 RepID=UPI0013DC940B|nr:hypothetical protein [Virgibacillus sp. YIM 98842]